MIKIQHILARWLENEQPTDQELTYLANIELNDQSRSQAFGITETDAREYIAERSQLWITLYPQIEKLCRSLGFNDSALIAVTLWNLWLPLALLLINYRQQVNRTLIQGILGGQGTGKTSLSWVLGFILGHFGYSCLGVSLDDFYQTYHERQLLQQHDPRLIWRGPPGTHDVDLAIDTITKLRDSQLGTEVFVPRFDKSLYNGAGDRAAFQKVTKPDIVLFEGWFVGVHPIDPEQFAHAPAPILTPEDRRFAEDMNQRLADYLPLWGLLDRLLVLAPIDYRLSKQWRKEAEQKMIASGRNGMNDLEIERFVDYFWRSLHPELFIDPLLHNPQLVDLVITINADHSPGRIYSSINHID